jgi:hypothetical protein
VHASKRRRRCMNPRAPWPIWGQAPPSMTGIDSRVMSRRRPRRPSLRCNNMLPHACCRPGVFVGGCQQGAAIASSRGVTGGEGCPLDSHCAAMPPPPGACGARWPGPAALLVEPLRATIPFKGVKPTLCARLGTNSKRHPAFGLRAGAPSSVSGPSSQGRAGLIFMRVFVGLNLRL